MTTIDNKSKECKFAFENVICPYESSAYALHDSTGHSPCFGRNCYYFEPIENTKPVERATVKGLNHNPVEHPNHYCQGGIECIKAIEAAMPPEGFQDYCKGNILKYIWRWRDKAGVEDLKKAKVYLEWLIESAEKGSEEN